MPEGAHNMDAQSCYMARSAAYGTRTCTGDWNLSSHGRYFTGYCKNRSVHMSVGASSKLAAFWNHPAGPKNHPLLGAHLQM